MRWLIHMSSRYRMKVPITSESRGTSQQQCRTHREVLCTDRCGSGFRWTLVGRVKACVEGTEIIARGVIPVAREACAFKRDQLKSVSRARSVTAKHR